MLIDKPKPGQTATQAAEALLDLRRYAPFRLGGVWYCGVDSSGQAWAYRSKARAENRARESEIKSYCKVGG